MSYYSVIYLLSLLSIIFVFSNTNIMYNLIYFASAIILMSVLLVFYKLSLFSFVIIIVYVGAITVLFLLTVGYIDIQNNVQSLYAIASLSIIAYFLIAYYLIGSYSDEFSFDIIPSNVLNGSNEMFIDSCYMLYNIYPPIFYTLGLLLIVNTIIIAAFLIN